MLDRRVGGLVNLGKHRVLGITHPLAIPGNVFPFRNIKENLTDGLCVECLNIEQFVRNAIQRVTVTLDNETRLFVRLCHQVTNLFINRLCHMIGVSRLVCVVPAKEHLPLRIPVSDGSKLVAHAPFHDHPAGKGGGLFDVIRGTTRWVAEHDFLRSASAKRHRQTIDQLSTKQVGLVLGGQRQCEPTRAATRNDRDLVHRIGVRQRKPDKSVTRLVEGGNLALLFRDHLVLPFRTRDHAIDGLFEVRHRYFVCAATRRKQCPLVDEVRKIRTGEPRCLTGECANFDVVRQRLALRVNREDALAASDVGAVDNDLTVKTARAQQRRVENVWTVRRRENDHTGLALKTVEFDKKLVQGLLALIVTSAETSASVPTHCVDFVDEHNRRGSSFCLRKQVADSAGTDTHKHLDEVRTRDGEERYVRFPGNGPGKQRLAGPGRADQ